MVIESENTKGNPYHDSSDGQFTSKTQAKAEGIDVDNSKQEKPTQTNAKTLSWLGPKQETVVEDSNKLSWLGPKSEGESLDIEEKDELSALLNDDEADVSNLSEDIKSLTYDEAFNSVLALSDVDKDKVYSMSEQEAKELLQASKLLLEKNKDISLEELNSQQYFGISPNPLSPSDYLGKKDSVEKKEDYYKNIFQGTEEQKQEKLDNLHAWVEAGKKYEEAKTAFDEKYQQAQDLFDKYTNDKYSETKKKAAIYIGASHDQVISTGSNKDELIDRSENVFGVYEGPNGKTTAALDKLAKEDQAAYKEVKNYTESYKIFNEPLSGKTYYGGSKDAFVSKVENLTRAIDASSYNFDCYVYHRTADLILGGGVVLSNDTPTSELSKYVGQTFKYNSFYSAGAAKGTGYGNDNVIMHTFCPKGTKMLYVRPVSSYKAENEMIIQRGYTMQIKKMYYTYNSWGDKSLNIDVDVLLGTDKDKYNHEQLVDIAKTKVK